MSLAGTPLEGIADRITGFAIDHRKIAPGCVFGAFRGRTFDAETVIPAAIASGAIAVVARPEARVEGALHITAGNPRATFAALAGAWYAPYPARIAAVTGTNGKTSTVEITRQLWHLLGERAASIGTLGVITADERVKAGQSALTTPDIVTFLATAAGLAREGITHLAFEASSHGLDQHRTEGLPLHSVAFTNLSRDHLDYHGSMEAYLAAKLRLFTVLPSPGTPAIIFRDTAHEGAHWTERVIEAAAARGLAVHTVGPDGDLLRLVSRVPTRLGQRLLVEHRGTRHELLLPLIGGYQAANALVAAGIVIALGHPAERVLGGLARITPIRGRLERAVVTAAGAPVYVDYAHTPDALAAATAALRPHTANRLILVFGCGGDRDRGKRPLMGRVAAEAADLVLVTDDNPRSEAPEAIRAEILAGAPDARAIAGRREAIREAIAIARDGDVVLIAGKGHEQGQIIGSEIHPFDDVAVAREEAGA